MCNQAILVALWEFGRTEFIEFSYLRQIEGTKRCPDQTIVRANDTFDDLSTYVIREWDETVALFFSLDQKVDIQSQEGQKFILSFVVIFTEEKPVNQVMALHLLVNGIGKENSVVVEQFEEICEHLILGLCVFSLEESDEEWTNDCLEVLLERIADEVALAEVRVIKLAFLGSTVIEQ